MADPAETFSVPVEEYEDIAPPQVREGTIDNTPADVTDPLFVTCQGFSEQHQYGPCPWQPRIVDGASFATPSAGDRAVVVITDLLEPWVIMWWPQEYDS